MEIGVHLIDITRQPLPHGFPIPAGSFPDGIMLMGCKKGEDYQCHFVTGSALAFERMSKIDDTLNQLQLEPERVRVCEVEITDIHRTPKLINDYAAKIDEIGMNPFKGF